LVKINYLFVYLSAGTKKKIFIPLSYKLLGSKASIVGVYSPHCLKVKGLSLAVTPGTGELKMSKMTYFSRYLRCFFTEKKNDANYAYTHIEGISFLGSSQGILMGQCHCTVDLLFDWFGISCTATEIFCFYLENSLIQTSQTGGQWYSDTSPFSIPCCSIHENVGCSNGNVLSINLFLCKMKFSLRLRPYPGKSY
jgi:hypothetical protein